ncbi:macro domain-containing protein [Risungbinella massiliensis]|uniref:macro domain-containing protein n=1 Tax=Risungbinella massiliensis TaxID=1329796 RepID=UPI0005CBF855|nr:macro domain-containing protein [Risungbinella massiliensis]
MQLREEQKNLFSMPEEYYLAHCISADAKMGAGIALEFRKKFQLDPLQVLANIKLLEIGKCYPMGRTFNLVTKIRYWHKPTYSNLKEAILSMKNYCLERDLTYLAIPKLGCGLDRLKWQKVKGIIEEVFQDTQMEIVVCDWNGN